MDFTFTLLLLYFSSFLVGGKGLSSGLQPELSRMAGLEFSIMNSTSSMSLGVENPMVSGRKMKRAPLMRLRTRQILRKLRKKI